MHFILEKIKRGEFHNKGGKEYRLIADLAYPII